MLRELVRLRDRNQLTLPSEIAEKLDLKPGSLVELSVSEAGHVELRAAHIVTAGTPAAQREEGRAEQDVREGRSVTLNGSAEVRQHMRQLRSQQEAQNLAEQLDALQQRMQNIHLELNDTQAAIKRIGVVSRTNVQNEAR
jgi:AbrB family looped-hinge helix DNA binding protein